MQVHNLPKPAGNIKKEARIGRGGKRGKTSGRGTKGQKAHGGHGIRPEMRDLIKKLPKLRGYGRNRARTVNAERTLPIIVNLSALEGFKGGVVSPTTLVQAGVISTQGGKTPKVKILAKGTFSTKISVEKCVVSASAKALIEKAGGQVA